MSSLVLDIERKSEINLNGLRIADTVQKMPNKTSNPSSTIDIDNNPNVRDLSLSDAAVENRRFNPIPVGRESNLDLSKSRKASITAINNALFNVKEAMKSVQECKREMNETRTELNGFRKSIRELTNFLDDFLDQLKTTYKKCIDRLSSLTNCNNINDEILEAVS